MNKKRLALVLALIVLTITLTGCIQTTATYYLDGNSINKIIFETAYDKDMMEQLGSSPEDDEELSEGELTDALLGAELEGANISITPLSYKDGNSNYVGQRYELIIDNFEEYEEDLEEGVVSITPLGNNKFRLEIAIDNSSSGLLADDDTGQTGDLDVTGEEYLEQFKEMGSKMIISIKTDNKVISHNADEVIDGEYKWSLLEGWIYGTKETLFIEYEFDGSEAQSPSKAPNKEDFIKNNNLDLNDSDFYGKALECVNVLYGTDQGLDLDKDLNRLQGALVYARLLGLDQAIKDFEKTNPDYDSGFTDIPSWAEPQLNYLHHKKLVFGKGNNLYGTYDPMSETEFTALVLRALGYSEANKDFVFIDATKMASEIGFYLTDVSEYTIKDKDKLLRGDMAYIAFNSLFIQNKAKTGFLMDVLSINQ